MDLRDYLRLLRRRWPQVALVTALGVGLAGLLLFVQVPTYRATTTLFVSTPFAAGTSASSAYDSQQFSAQRVKSYIELLHGPRVAASVRAKLGTADSVDQLLQKTSASSIPDSVLLTVSADDPSPPQAQRLADTFAQQFSLLAAALEQVPGSDQSPVRVIVAESARLPTQPVSPRPLRELGLGLVIGLLLAVALAVLRESLDTSVRDEDDVRSAVDLPTVGHIAFDRDAAKRPLLVSVDPSSARAEAFRTLRTNLRYVDVATPPRSVVMTSSLPEEGKSTTTCNLAIALAQAGTRVLLVEADLRRPKVADYLGLVGAVGLTSVLVGSATLEDAIQTWGEERLLVLASGPVPPNPAELLGSPAMAALMQRLEGLADIVLVDAPPLLPVTDAALLGAVCSGVLLVCRRGATRREQLARAAEALRAVDARVYGVVLNMVPVRGAASRYYGYVGEKRGTGDPAVLPVQAAAVPVPSGTATRPVVAGAAVGPEPAVALVAPATPEVLASSSAALVGPAGTAARSPVGQSPAEPTGPAPAWTAPSLLAAPGPQPHLPGLHHVDAGPPNGHVEGLGSGDMGARATWPTATG